MITDAQAELVITKTLTEQSPDQDAHHWSRWPVATATGMCQLAVADLAGVRPQGVFDTNLEAQQQPGVHRQGPRHGSLLSPGRSSVSLAGASRQSAQVGVAASAWLVANRITRIATKLPFIGLFL